MASGWNLWILLPCIGVVSGCCCKEVYRYPHTIIINFPYSTCIRSFFGSSIPTSLFIFIIFFGLVSVIFLTIHVYSKRYSKNIRDRSKKSRSREYNYLIISIIKNVKRASTVRACESRDFHVQRTE